MPTAPKRSKTPAEFLGLVQRSVHLPNDALVVRGGQMKITDLQRAVELSVKRLKYPGISVYAAEVLAPADLLQQTNISHEEVRFSTVGQIREAGFVIEPTYEAPHCTLWLPLGGGALTDALRRIVDCFEPAQRRIDVLGDRL